MKNIIRNIILCAMLLCVVSSCDRTIHQYPFTQTVGLTVELSADLTPPQYYCEKVYDARTGVGVMKNVMLYSAHNPKDDAPRFTEEAVMRFTVDLCVMKDGVYVPVSRRCYYTEIDTLVPQGSVTFDMVPVENIKVLVWCDYVRKLAQNKSWYYDNTDLKNIRYTDELVVDNDDKEAYTTAVEVDMSKYIDLPGEYHDTIDVKLTRPLGRYVVRCDDLDAYRAMGGDPAKITLEVTYKEFVSAGYNVEDQAPNYFEPSRKYVSSAIVREGGDIDFAYDYVFVNGSQSNYMLYLVFSDEKGNEISRWDVRDVPVLRNRETIVKGSFLTRSYEGKGTGIDDNFDGEIEIDM